MKIEQMDLEQGTVVLWRGELSYSRIVMLSWFGYHGCCGLFLYCIGTGYLFIDWIALGLLGLNLCQSKQRHLIQQAGSLLWYKSVAGDYIYYKGRHYKLRHYPRRFYYFILFEMVNGVKSTKISPVLLVAKDSVSYRQWRELTSVIAYQQLLRQSN